MRSSPAAASIGETKSTGPIALLLCVVFFFSGAAGVSLEALWFRVLGLTLGNSVWASNIVLASFMAGLAAGNAIAARYGQRVRRPLRLYALVEIVVGVIGVGIVFSLPPLSPALGRLFSHVLTQLWLVLAQLLSRPTAASPLDDQRPLDVRDHLPRRSLHEAVRVLVSGREPECAQSIADQLRSRQHGHGAAGQGMFLAVSAAVQTSAMSCDPVGFG